MAAARAGVIAVLASIVIAGCGPRIANVAATPSPVSVDSGAGFVAVSAGGEHSCGITEDDRILCWGLNTNGVLGTTAIAGRFSAVPVAVAADEEWASVSTSRFVTCGVTIHGAAYCWGADSVGETGNGSRTTSAPPMPVKSYVTATGIAMGLNHGCAIATAGALSCWGNNGAGAVGNGEHTGVQTTAVMVPTSRTFVAASAGNNLTCALTRDGAAYCWGWNSAGQLGTGTSGGYSAVPVAVRGGRTFTSLAVGGDHACALERDGTAWCWGANKYGELGKGDTVPAAVPVAVAGTQRFTALSSDYYSTCGVASSGEAFCWGGIIGSRVPMRVAPGQRFSAVAVGSRHACGLTGTGHILCWGANEFGQLGTGAAGDPSATPLLVRADASRLSSTASGAASGSVEIFPPFAPGTGTARAPATATGPCPDTGQATVTSLRGDRSTPPPAGSFLLHAPGLPNVAATSIVPVRYPPKLLATRVQGTVSIKFWINPSGCAEPESFRIVSARDSSMAAAVRDALRRARFETYPQNGKGQWQEVEEYFTFRIAH